MRHLFSFVCGFLLCSLLQLCVVDGDKHTTVVLVGATGDLAGKYLWQSIFNVYSNSIIASKKSDADLSRNHSFNFIGVTRQAQEKGTALLNKRLQDSVECGVGFMEPELLANCSARKQSFINSVEYVQISNNHQDYVVLCNRLQELLPKAEHDMTVKKEIIMYMAISTTPYITFLEKFKKNCDNGLFQSDVKIRWALEKPFGIDKMSSEKFADKLLATFEEKDIYHVDHYLQKSIVKSILSFRYLNPNLEKLWNKNNIERVEIVLKETVNVKDRVLFYNSMGVLRDIHQNHLTELLALVAMELPSDIHNPEEISKHKADLLRHVESVKSSNALFGQYSAYAKHVSLELTNDTKTSDVATFAATLVKINSARWRDIPFLLVSGKNLDKRESFIKVVFKNVNMCVSQCQLSRPSLPLVVFHIGNGDVPRPSILVSKSFKKPLWPSNVAEFENFGAFNTSAVYQTNINNIFIGAVVNDIPPYQSVIGDLVRGVRNHFATTRRLLLSWHIWDHIVTMVKTPRIYDKGDPQGDLNFKFDENSLEFIHSGTVTSEFLRMKKDGQSLEGSPVYFLGRKLVTTSPSYLPSVLAKAIGEEAKEEVKHKGVFHIALSGGTSISPVLQSLVRNYLSLPWDSIHVWQVDERCVHHHDQKSNFGLLDRELFQLVNIPFSNIHALPVDIAGELCEENLSGAHLYTLSIKQHVNHAQFDMVVLGVGTDGHTAGLFPGSTALHVDSDTFVTISDDGPAGSKRRMSLTLPIINRSKKIAILVTGRHKRDILQRLETSSSLDKYPILGVNPKNGTVTWYIDDPNYDNY